MGGGCEKQSLSKAGLRKSTLLNRTMTLENTFVGSFCTPSQGGGHGGRSAGVGVYRKAVLVAEELSSLK